MTHICRVLFSIECDWCSGYNFKFDKSKTTTVAVMWQLYNASHIPVAAEHRIQSEGKRLAKEVSEHSPTFDASTYKAANRYSDNCAHWCHHAWYASSSCLQHHITTLHVYTAKTTSTTRHDTECLRHIVIWLSYTWQNLLFMSSMADTFPVARLLITCHPAPSHWSSSSMASVQSGSCEQYLLQRHWDHSVAMHGVIMHGSLRWVLTKGWKIIKS